MKERIKLLIEQAQDWADAHAPYASEEQEYFAKKFAELIIQECLLALEPDLYESDIEYKVDQAFYKKCERIIKKHFGVDE
jgi:hypothetical protein